MSETPSHNQSEFIDQQRELSGAGGAKEQRFFDEGGTPRSRQEKERKARANARAFNRLMELMQDPAYAAAFDAANDAIDDVQRELDAALEENARYIADLEDRAVKLPDGRAVFLRADGTGETTGGEVIPLSVMATLDIPADAPTIEEYDAARERRRQLGGYADDINAARKKVNNPDDPLDEDGLDDITKDMRDIQRSIEATPTVLSNFNQASSEQALEKPLELGSVPGLPR